MGESVNERLEQSLHGQPQLNIDEKRMYLGNLRERIFVRMTVAQTKDPTLIKLLLSHFSELKEQKYIIYINGKIPNTPLINSVISTASKANISFSMINDETAKSADDATGIVVVAPTAIKQELIEISEKFVAEQPSTKSEKKVKDHSSFFDNLFNK